MSGIRPAAVAGRFYPAEAAALAQQVSGFLANAVMSSALPALAPKAIIAPHAGYVFSGHVAAAAYARLAPGRGTIKRVVAVGPSHFVGFPGFAGSTSDAWQTPLGAMRVGRPAAGVALSADADRALAQEYSVEVHLPFLQSALGNDIELVPVAAGNATPEAMAGLLDALWGGPETLIVISSDLSHFLGYRPAQEIDSRTSAAIEGFDADVLTPQHACGHLPVGGLLVAAKRRGMTVATLNLANSGDVGGPMDRVVGYGAWAFYERQSPGEPVADLAVLSAAGPVLIELARASIINGLATGGPLVPASGHKLPAIITAPGASFVTLKRKGRLRGCVGTFVAARPLFVDVAVNAFNAAFRDPRFLPLRHDELGELEVSLSLLTQPAEMVFADEADLLSQLEPHIDGLIIADRERRALFLPSVWEQIPDKRQFLTHLKLKAGLAADHWSPGFKAHRFRAVEAKPAPASPRH